MSWTRRRGRALWQPVEVAVEGLGENLALLGDERGHVDQVARAAASEVRSIA
jgi:hypothetical protein